MKVTQLKNHSYIDPPVISHLLTADMKNTTVVNRYGGGGSPYHNVDCKHDQTAWDSIN